MEEVRTEMESKLSLLWTVLAHAFPLKCHKMFAYILMIHSCISEKRIFIVCGSLITMQANRTRMLMDTVQDT